MGEERFEAFAVGAESRTFWKVPVARQRHVDWTMSSSWMLQPLEGLDIYSIELISRRHLALIFFMWAFQYSWESNIRSRTLTEKKSWDRFIEEEGVQEWGGEEQRLKNMSVVFFTWNFEAVFVEPKFNFLDTYFGWVWAYWRIFVCRWILVIGKYRIWKSGKLKLVNISFIACETGPLIRIITYMKCFVPLKCPGKFPDK